MWDIHSLFLPPILSLPVYQTALTRTHILLSPRVWPLYIAGMCLVFIIHPGHLMSSVHQIPRTEISHFCPA